MGNIIWNESQGWHDGPEATIHLDSAGRIRIRPVVASRVGRAVTPDSLNAAVEFDCPFTVKAGHTRAIFDAPAGTYAPTSYDGELDSDDWEYWSDGRSGQYGYAGPIMHPSEYIGATMAAELLSEPGTYCVIADGQPETDDFNGWAIVRLIDDAS